MYLTREEEDALMGEMGPSLRKAMEILVGLGDIYGAERLIPIESVQVAGVSYKTIGDAGLEWIDDMEGRAKVPAMLNPAGMDRQRWREMGITKDFSAKQLEVLNAYESLGITPECTCTPYYLNGPDKGDHLAWSESSAVSYANSVLGARTNREGGPSALSAALIGKTPEYGLHLDAKRRPTVTVRVEGRLHKADYGALGYLVGRRIGDDIPYFQLSKVPRPDDLKALGAAMAASGSVALYHVENATPEACQYTPPGERITIDTGEIRDVYGDPDGVDIVALGCPHYSDAELRRLAGLLIGREVKRPLWVCTSRTVYERNPDLVQLIEKSGARVFCDTCMVVSPASENYECMMVDSGKALRYVPALCGVEAVLGSMRECVEAACK